MASGSSSESHAQSGVQYFPGQEKALSAVFGDGGVFGQLLSGKPDPGFERQQMVGLQQLQQRQAQAGTLNSPLGTRQSADYLTKSNFGAGDNWWTHFMGLLQPAGSQSKSSSNSASGSVL